MNPFLIDELFDSPDRLSRLTSGLPYPFEVVKNECRKGSPEVGTLREHVLSGFFLQEFGRQHVVFPDDGNQKEIDLEIAGGALSIKTVTSSGYVKVVWTADTSSVRREKEIYKPTCDMFLVRIFWGEKRDSIFYIPLEVQLEVYRKFGSDYLKSATNTNNRGIEIASQCMNLLQADANTRRVSVEWNLSGYSTAPEERWIEYWKERPSPLRQSI